MQQQMLTLFEVLRQENRDLRDELRDQRLGFEMQVKALQKESENQAFRTPDSHPGGESRSGEERLPASLQQPLLNKSGKGSMSWRLCSSLNRCSP